MPLGKLYFASAGRLVPLSGGPALPGGGTDPGGGGTTPPPVGNRNAMLVGAATETLQGTDFEEKAAAAGPWTVRRSYTGATSGWPVATFAQSTAGPDVGKRASVWSAKPNIVSMANGSLDSAVLSFLRSIPQSHTCWVTIWHEPEAKIRDSLFTLTEYKAGFRRFCELVRQVQSEGWTRLWTYQCVTSWAGQHPQAGTTYAEMWPGNGLVDCFAVDGYSSLGSESSLWGPALEFARSKNVAWAIPEIGWSSTETKTTQWLQDQADYAGSNGSGGHSKAAFLCWFDLIGPLGGIATPGSDTAGQAKCREISQQYYSDYLQFVL